jgi:hypothetical protein
MAMDYYFHSLHRPDLFPSKGCADLENCYKCGDAAPKSAEKCFERKTKVNKAIFMGVEAIDFKNEIRHHGLHEKEIELFYVDIPNIPRSLKSWKIEDWLK